jgi:hypothetical protein
MMKKIFITFILVILALTNSCSQKTEDDKKYDKKAPVIKFETLVYDYGTIVRGSDGLCVFIFENAGKNPLVLNNVKPTCGCTVPKWSKEPIKSGKKSGIEVKYNTRRVGSFSKSITVYSNASNSPVVLRIKGKVEAEPPAEKQDDTAN